MNLIKQETIVQNLKDAGCTDDFVARFLQIMKRGSTVEQLRLLSNQRSRLLEQLHIEQKKLDCLDFLRYSLQKQAENTPSPPKQPQKDGTRKVIP